VSNLDLFSGKDKAEIAIERLQTFCPPEGYYVAFSGGKDSVVILDLVKRSGCKFDAHYNLTTVDPPELVQFIKREHPEVEIHRPEKTMWKLIEENGMPPTRIIRYCCRILKEGGGSSRYVVVGIRWEESARRNKRKMVEACFRDDRRFYVHPIIDWTSTDVWQYIRSRELKYCSLYDEGWKRIGCILCPMNRNREKEADRWPKYKKQYIKALDKALIRSRSKGNKSTFINGEDFFDWWISLDKKHLKDDPDQTVMFE
jgi:phosphoadenosine phosphosulfate reductase